MRWPFKIMGLFIFFCFLLIMAHSCGKTPAKAHVAAVPFYDEEFEARSAAERAVTGTLQSPSTAKFIDQYSVKNKEGSWDITGSLDALNSYGVPIRYQYLCTFRREGEAMRLIKFSFPF